jgi:hypothetical protein
VVRKDDFIVNVRNGKKVKVGRLVRMHSDDKEDITEAGAGDICALFGVDCNSGDTFTDGSVNYAMTSMFVPQPVISVAIPKPQRSHRPNSSPKHALWKTPSTDTKFEIQQRFLKLMSFNLRIPRAEFISGAPFLRSSKSLSITAQRVSQSSARSSVPGTACGSSPIST